MLEYFSDWIGTATFSRTVTTKDAANRPVVSIESINAGADIPVGRWVDSSVQTSSNDKFALSEVGKLVLNYQVFFVRSVVGGTTTDTTVLPDATWHATIGGKKYHIEGVDNVGGQNEVYLFTYRKDR